MASEQYTYFLRSPFFLTHPVDTANVCENIALTDIYFWSHAIIASRMENSVCVSSTGALLCIYVHVRIFHFYFIELQHSFSHHCVDIFVDMCRYAM